MLSPRLQSATRAAPRTAAITAGRRNALSDRPARRFLSAASSASGGRPFHHFEEEDQAPSVHSFDTYRFVQRLEADGFTRESAEAIMNSLSEVVKESIHGISATSISKSEFEKTMYMNTVDFNHFRSELHLRDANETAVIRAEAARLSADLNRLRLRSAEELRRIQSNVRLELGQEKARIRDEMSVQEIKIREADARIESEAAAVATTLEGIPWELFKTLFPLFCAAGALAFSYLRFIR
ncbi:mitochondrion protein [Zopfochytrium polystomum]|nr:mitochondrion protein [Zopfochytrium polystomum]KAI9359337.1 mitochondrion protein [Zopfochytrium polystomum]